MEGQMLSSPDLVRVIDEYLDSTEDRLSFFWYRVDGSRHEYARSLRVSPSRHVIVPIVAGGSFARNPDSILHDMMLETQNEEDWIRAALRSKMLANVGILFLSKRDLDTPSLCSPVDVPEGFPLVGGTTIESSIIDLRHVGGVPLDANTVRKAELATLLVALERASLERISVRLSDDRDSTERLLMALFKCKTKQQGYKKISQLQDTLRRLEEGFSAGYRPSLEKDDSLSAIFIRRVFEVSPYELGELARLCARLLDLDQPEPLQETIISVLLTASKRDTERTATAGRVFLLAVVAAYRLITASSHAADYGKFPEPIVDAVARDTSRSLRELIVRLQTSSQSVLPS
jgi:hypothetical protein